MPGLENHDWHADLAVSYISVSTKLIDTEDWLIDLWEVYIHKV